MSIDMSNLVIDYCSRLAFLCIPLLLMSLVILGDLIWGTRSGAIGSVCINIAIVVALAIIGFCCWLKSDIMLVCLDQQEVSIIRKYRAEQMMLKAQQELQKLQQKGLENGNDQN